MCIIYMLMLARANPKRNPKLVPEGTRRTQKYQREGGAGGRGGRDRQTEREIKCAFAFASAAAGGYIYVCRACATWHVDRACATWPVCRPARWPARAEKGRSA